MTATIPATHHDLLTGTVHGILSTLMPDGQPQSSMVWVDYDGEHVLINTTLERQKVRNMQANPKVTLLVVDPTNSNRWIEIRGTMAALITEGAEAHADQLARRYSSGQQQRFYGDVYPVAQRDRETRVIVKIAPHKVNLDPVFK